MNDRIDAGRVPLRTRACAAAALALLLVAGCGPADDGTAAARNLVLISIDTLRADRLGAYGYERSTSPVLDALAGRGVRFETVIAESGWTLPSHVTLLSGLPPALHGAVVPEVRVAADVPLLAEVLRGAGFRTLGFTAGHFLARRFGFDRGFETFDDGDLTFARALAGADAAIRALPRDARFFAFVHTYDVHCPYSPPETYAARFQTRPRADHLETDGRCGNPQYNAMALTPGQVKFLSDRYDASIRFADELLGRFLGGLERAGILEDTLVVVVSDHGEEFMEHGKIGHRAMLTLPTVRVPWLMAGPGVSPSVVTEPVGLADVMPTLLELLGVPGPPMRGESMVPLLRGERAARPERLLFSENRWGPHLYGAVVGDDHVVVDGATGTARLYRWREDPLEGEDRAPAEAERARALSEAARRRLLELQRDAQGVTVDRVEIPTEAQLERLRALGYVEP